MKSKSEPKLAITNMTIEALDVEELEQRLELATQAACCDCCGTHNAGCTELVCFADPVASAKPREGC